MTGVTDRPYYYHIRHHAGDHLLLETATLRRDVCCSASNSYFKIQVSQQTHEDDLPLLLVAQEHRRTKTDISFVRIKASISS